jgi:hypothetical protein
MATTMAAPLGAPIGGDVPQEWLKPPVWCLWDDTEPATFLLYQPQ